jgi:hypothetical protein
MNDIKTKSSKYVGVSYDVSRGRYKATVKKDGKLINLGRFDTEEEAFEVRQKYIDENMKL